MSENDKSPETFDERIKALQESHAFSLKLHADMIISIDTRLEQLAIEVVSMRKGIAELTENSKRDADNIRALVRIAEMHDRRLTAVEEAKE